MAVSADVLTADSDEYESARRSQIARFDGVGPRAVVRCRTPEDIARALASAREGLHVALRSGGHCFAGRSSTTGMVVDVSGIDEVSVSDGSVTVGAGSRLADVYDKLAGHDRTIAAGCGPTVGIAGLTLGGGLGILGRSHGLTADQLVGAPPAQANYVPGPYRDIKRYLAEYDICSGERRPVEREAGHSYSKSEFFRRELPGDLIPELLSHFVAARRPREARVLDLTPWAGVYNRVSIDATAFAHRAERFLLKHEVVVDAGASATERQAGRGWLSRSRALVHPWGSGGVYPNFPDPELQDWANAYHGANLDRLRRVKAKYDPENVFRFHQSVEPT